MQLARLAISAILFMATTASAQRRASPPQSGAWTIGTIARGDTSWSWATLQFSADSVRGETGSTPRNPMRGTIRGDSVDILQYWDSTNVRARYRGVVRDGRLVGMVTVGARRGEPLADTAAWFATLQPVRTGPPRMITFEPTMFHRRFSGAIAPALHI